MRGDLYNYWHWSHEDQIQIQDCGRPRWKLWKKNEYSQKLVEDRPLMINKSWKNRHKSKKLQATKMVVFCWWGCNDHRWATSDLRWSGMIRLKRKIIYWLPMFGRWFRRRSQITDDRSGFDTMTFWEMAEQQWCFNTLKNCLPIRDDHPFIIKGLKSLITSKCILKIWFTN